MGRLLDGCDDPELVYRCLAGAGCLENECLEQKSVFAK
jgi:hypothetical protein